MPSIRKRGVKWQVQVRRKGSRYISKSFYSLKDAQAWGRQMELQADRRDLPPDFKVLERLTLGDLVVRYRDTVSPKKRTGGAEQIILNAFLRWPISRRRLSEITRADFVVYRDERLQQVKPSSLRRELVPIHHLYEVARTEWGLPIKENPAAKLDVKGTDPKRERRLREREWPRLVEALESCRNPLLLSVIRVAVSTGLRRGELLSIRWDHIDWQSRALLVPQTKNGHSRTIPLSAEAVQVLEAVPKTHDRVFPMTANAVRLAWERLKRRAGILDLRFHDLRHEAISRFFDLGLTVPEVAMLSGHRDMRMLLRYSHGMRKRILEKLDAARLQKEPSGECRLEGGATVDHDLDQERDRASHSRT